MDTYQSGAKLVQAWRTSRPGSCPAIIPPLQNNQQESRCCPASADCAWQMCGVVMRRHTLVPYDPVTAMLDSWAALLASLGLRPGAAAKAFLPLSTYATSATWVRALHVGQLIRLPCRGCIAWWQLYHGANRTRFIMGPAFYVASWSQQGTCVDVLAM